jgi:hypothetical protein
VEADEFDAGREHALDQRGDALRIDAKGLGAPAHAHAGTLDFEIGVNPDRHARRKAKAVADRDRAFRLAFGFTVDRDQSPDRFLELPIALSRTGEAHHPGIEPRLHSDAQFPARGQVHALDHCSNMLE